MTDQTPSLAGKVAIVTGSTSGIGEAIARHFTAAGASVLLNSRSSVDAGRALEAELADSLYVQGSIAEADVPQRLVDAAIERWGHVDVLVNNAGTTRSIPHHDLDAASLEVWREIFETNVFGTYEFTRVAVPHLKQVAGNVINITSLAGLRPTGSSVPYASSKAALNHLTALLAKALGPDVRVNAIAPGLVETPWTADWGPLHEAVGATAPMRRSATPADIVDIALLLATNTYVTGEVIAVDGGLNLT